MPETLKDNTVVSLDVSSLAGQEHAKGLIAQFPKFARDGNELFRSVSAIIATGNLRHLKSFCRVVQAHIVGVSNDRS